MVLLRLSVDHCIACYGRCSWTIIDLCKLFTITEALLVFLVCHYVVLCEYAVVSVCALLF